MPAPEFLDTNVLVYAYDSSDARKQKIAQNLLRHALAGNIAISTQVLAEFSATLLHNISPAVTPEALSDVLKALAPIRLIATDGDIVRRAVEVRAKYRVHFYDCMILATEERGGCNKVWSEDLNSGQKYFGVKVQNPFI